MWKYNNTDELYHYGVLGMRWGHRKPSDISLKKQKYLSLKKDYKNSMLSKKEEYQKAKQDYKDAKLLRKAKRNRNIKRGVAIAATGLAVYGAYKLNKLLKNKDAVYTFENKGIKKEFYGKDGYNVAKSLVKTILTRNKNYLDYRISDLM